MKYEVELTDEQAREFATHWPDEARPRRGDSFTSTVRDEYLGAAYAIADAIRANPPKPPRMDEPGWGEKVIAHTSKTGSRRRPFVNAYTGSEVGTTWTDMYGYHAAWSDLIDPEPWRADA